MNFYDFSGGIVNQKSPYLLKKDEALELCNFNVEAGGLKVRAGTVKKYGPFVGEVTAIHKCLSAMGHEILFVQCGKYLEMVVGGVKCKYSMLCNTFKVLPVTDGFAFLSAEQARYLKLIFRRVDGIISIQHPWDGYMILERLPDDYSTLGDFPADLYGKTIWDEATDTLYYAKAHTDATRENIADLLTTDQFERLGELGGLVYMKYAMETIAKLDCKTLHSDSPYFTREITLSMMGIFDVGPELSETGAQACRCPYIVWHPASMRYFAAGHPDYPTALFISEPNEWHDYQKENMLYPHLHLGKITGLSVVEKSVVVSYEHGWSHYVGSDPTEDGQWSLLSVPDGTRYGKTVCTTPGSVSFLSDSGLVSFSASMLTVQMLYSPSSSLYKFLSLEKIALPSPKEKAFAFYRNGIYYLMIDDTMYLYHFILGAFLCYRGLTCQCMTESYSGELLMGAGNYVTAFSEGTSTDYDPKTDSDIPIPFSVKIPILGAVEETELARSEELAVKSASLAYPADCHIRLSSEREQKDGILEHTNHLSYQYTPWHYRYRDSSFSETVLPWKVTGNVFFLDIFGATNPKETIPLQIYNIYLKLKKERDK